MSMKVINDYLDEVDAPTMEQSALEDYTSQMRSELAEITQRHIAKSVAQMTAWNWSRGRGIEELTRRFQEEQEKEDIDMSKVLPNAETVIRTESMKIMNAEAWRSATEVGSYADGLLWGFSYHAVGDSRTRETHLAQHGVCAPVDDPFWNEWTPPNGYNCRCWLISEWEEPSSYKQPRRDLHPDPGFAFNPANNVSGRVPQPKKQEPKKPEVNTQSESDVKPDELGKDDAASEKNFEKKGKNIQKPVTSSKKKRYNNMGVSKSTVKPNAPRSPESPIPDEQEGTIIPTADGKFLAVHGPMVKTTRTMEAAEKAILDVGGKVPEEEFKNTEFFVRHSLDYFKKQYSDDWEVSYNLEDIDPKRSKAAEREIKKKLDIVADYTLVDNRIAEETNKILIGLFSKLKEFCISDFGFRTISYMTMEYSDAVSELTNDKPYASYNSETEELTLPSVLTRDTYNGMKLDMVIYYLNGLTSTNSPMHVILHEIGHAIYHKMLADKKVSKSQQKQLIKLWEKFNSAVEKDQIKWLSKRACVSVKEMIAEAFAQYFNGTASKLTSQIIQLLHNKD